MDSGKGQLVRYQVTRGDTELGVVTSDDLGAPGTLLWRRVGTRSWSERSLTLLEFQLLRALCRAIPMDKMIVTVEDDRELAEAYVDPPRAATRTGAPPGCTCTRRMIGGCAIT